MVSIRLEHVKCAKLIGRDALSRRLGDERMRTAPD